MSQRIQKVNYFPLNILDTRKNYSLSVHAGIPLKSLGPSSKAAIKEVVLSALHLKLHVNTEERAAIKLAALSLFSFFFKGLFMMKQPFFSP